MPASGNSSRESQPLSSMTGILTSLARCKPLGFLGYVEKVMWRARMKDSRCADYAEGLFSRDEFRSNRRYGCVRSRADEARCEYQLGASAAG